MRHTIDCIGARHEFEDEGEVIDIMSGIDGCDDESNLRLETKQAYSKVLQLAAIKEQCTFELRSRLLKDGFSQNAIDFALEKACRLGIVDDMRFAEQFARSQMAAGKGLVGIAAELRKRNLTIPSNSDIDFDGQNNAELERAVMYLQRKPPRSKNKREGAYRKLVQRGYGSEIASAAARIWSGSSSTWPDDEVFS